VPTYTVFFSDSGAGKTGLTPTVTWRHIDGSTAGTAPTVSEIDASNAPGWYSFDADPTERTVITVDAGTTLVGDSRIRSFEVSPRDMQDTKARHEVQAWDRIRATYAAINGDEEVPYSSAPTCIIQRVSDGQFYQSGGGWGALASFLTMTEPSALQFPGLYTYEPDSGDLSQDEQGYRIAIYTADTWEYVHVDPVDRAADVWDATAIDHATSGSMGMLLRIMAGLTHNNFRIENPVYSGSRMTSCDLVVYPTAADASAKTNALQTISVTCTYDTDGNLSTYLAEGDP